MKYQKCPKCDGQGTVSKPPWIAGDVTEWLSDSTSYQCDVCNGAKIIACSESPVGEQGLVSCEERLPEKTQTYLVYEVNHNKPYFELMWFDSQTKNWFIGADCYHPTHWIPLPAPPNQQSKKINQ